MGKLFCRCDNGQCQQRFREAPPGSPLALLNADVHVRGSVGRRGTNTAADVKVVQRALQAIPEQLGGKLDIKDDGIVGPITIGAIERFQRQHFGSDKADGTVDVRQRTVAKMSSLQPRKLARMEKARLQLASARECIRAGHAMALLAGTVSGTGGRRADELAERHFSLSRANNRSAALNLLRSTFQDMSQVFARGSAFGGDGFTQHFESEPFSNRGVFGFTALAGFRDSGVFGGIFESGVEQKWFRRDTIYLSAFFDVTTDDDRIQTIVHELGHFVSSKAEAIDDFAYGDADSPQVAKLSTVDKLHNAESIANFAFEAKFGRSPLHKT
jgi:peptidoglycan hydrolase-like protein with peptidoglycan-binding domain